MLYSTQERGSLCSVRKRQQGWRRRAVLSRRGSVRTLVRMQNIAVEWQLFSQSFIKVTTSTLYIRLSINVDFNRHCINYLAKPQWIKIMQIRGFDQPCVYNLYVCAQKRSFVCKDWNVALAVKKLSLDLNDPVRGSAGPFMLKYGPIECKNDIMALWLHKLCPIRSK